MRRVRVRVHGRVQGVGFRWTVRREASRLAVAGWVANCPDGSLEAVFEGAPEAVERMTELCRTGPPGASVSHIDERQEEPRNESGFRVR